MLRLGQCVLGFEEQSESHFDPCCLYVDRHTGVFANASTVHASKWTLPTAFSQDSQSSIPKAEAGHILPALKLAIFTKTNSRSPEHMQLWLAHHRAIGFSKFFVTWELDPDVKLPDLGKDVHLRVLHPHAHAGTDHSVDDAWVKHHNQALYERLAEEYFSQDLQEAKREHVDWALQIDDDELFYPRHGSAQDLLTNVAKNEAALQFRNWEADYDDSSKENCFGATHFKTEKDLFRSYSNGKSAGRIESPLVSFRHGPHYVADRENTRTVNPEDAVILHYPHCPYEKWKRTFLQMSLDPKPNFLDEFSFYLQSLGRMKKCSEFLIKDLPDSARITECKEKSLKDFWKEKTKIRDGYEIVRLTTVPSSVTHETSEPTCFPLRAAASFL